MGEGEHRLQRRSSFPPLQLAHVGPAIATGIAQTLLGEALLDSQGPEDLPERKIDCGPFYGRTSR